MRPSMRPKIQRCTGKWCWRSLRLDGVNMCELMPAEFCFDFLGLMNSVYLSFIYLIMYLHSQYAGITPAHPETFRYTHTYMTYTHTDMRMYVNITRDWLVVSMVISISSILLSGLGHHAGSCLWSVGTSRSLGDSRPGLRCLQQRPGRSGSPPRGGVAEVPRAFSASALGGTSHWEASVVLMLSGRPEQVNLMYASPENGGDLTIS